MLPQRSHDVPLLSGLTPVAAKLSHLGPAQRCWALSHANLGEGGRRFKAFQGSSSFHRPREAAEQANKRRLPCTVRFALRHGQAFGALLSSIAAQDGDVRGPVDDGWLRGEPLNGAKWH